MSDKKKVIGVINYGTNNIFSLLNALNFIGYNSKIINHYSDFEKIDCLILPGVGAFPKAMKEIINKDYHKAIGEFNFGKKKIIGICLGFQMLFDFSEEFSHTNGLGLIKGYVTPFSGKNLSIPLISWLKTKCNKNILNKKNLSGFLNNKYFYYIHSYYAEVADKTKIMCFSENNNFIFSSGILNDNIIGVQFHPEKSGYNGLKFLESLINV